MMKLTILLGMLVLINIASAFPSANEREARFLLGGQENGQGLLGKAQGFFGQAQGLFGQAQGLFGQGQNTFGQGIGNSGPLISLGGGGGGGGGGGNGGKGGSVLSPTINIGKF